MNREILFKGKRLDNGEWVQGYYYKSWDDVYIALSMINGKPDVVQIDPKTVGQYTGLEDKNGVEIYEEDVVKVTYYGEESVHVVKWMGGEWDYPAFDLEPFLDCDSNGLSYVMCDCECETEVVGNIHDNPELLEVE